MGTESRKQREIAQREQMLLDVARKMLVEHGYAGLSMDRIAEATEYSKGVIYQHFSSKEDLVAALAVQTQQRRVEVFRRAAGFAGRPRERMMAIGVAEELFVRLHPHHFHSERIVKMASLWDRASDVRNDLMGADQKQCFDVVLGIAEDAITQGDLVLPKSLLPAEIVLGLWALNDGSYTILHNDRQLLVEHGITAPFNAVRHHCHALMDGYGWKPLSHEWDYEQTFRRILQEVFPEECLQAGIL